MPELVAVPVDVSIDLEALVSDLEVSSLDGTISSDAMHDEEIDYRLAGHGDITAGCACGGHVTGTVSTV
jgi:hypothetical protein